MTLQGVEDRPAGAGVVRPNDSELTIGEMAAEFSVSLRTLRYYEDRKLLSPRREGNTRLYDNAQRARIERVLYYKSQGFTLAEIHDMLANNCLGVAQLSEAQIESQRAHLAAKLKGVQDEIARFEEEVRAR